MTKTIAIIPARGGSKRIPEKNIQTLGDLPLIAHSIIYAKENKAIIAMIANLKLIGFCSFKTYKPYKFQKY